MPQSVPPMTQNRMGNMKKFKNRAQTTRFAEMSFMKKEATISTSIMKKLTRLAAAAMRDSSLSTAAKNAASALSSPAVANKKYSRSWKA